ncbi:MAG: hypothetical protein ABEJ06_01525 [Haloarculaceae archaeon]
MVEWVATGTGVRALGRGAELTVGTRGWAATDSEHALPMPVDATATGTTSALSAPDATATVRTLGGGRPAGERETTLGDGDYLLTFGEEIEAVARFSGPARLIRQDATRLEFADPVPVTLGFRQQRRAPPTVTVPPDPEGVARALSVLSAAHRTDGPERSHPAMRDHPPLLELGDELAVPDAVREGCAERAGGVRLRVPPALDALFVTAPLGHYLGAEVTVGDADDPAVVETDDARHELGRPPALAEASSRLLREVFFLDSLAREVDAEGALCQSSVLESLGLDRAALADAPPAARLERYLDAPRAELSGRLPDWHLSTYVDPTPAHVRSLPYLLDRLSLVYLAEATTLDGDDRLARSLDDHYRGVAAVEPIDPKLGAGTAHGWLAPGEPIDAFKLSRDAFENRQSYRARRLDAILVDVVLNDEGMESERDVAEIYRERAADLPIEVTVRESLTTDELAGVFAAPNDFVHYVGHCDEAGLRCPDGNLSTADVDDVRTRTFFLNACGSYYEGQDLVEGGSVAGAVTLNRVLDRQAASVGTAFARLLSHGFDFERALELARRRIMSGKDYAVVGDATDTLTSRPDPPATVWLAGEGPFEVTYEVQSAATTGGSYRPPFGSCGALHGTPTEATLDRERLLGFLERTQVPVIYEGTFRWSDELAATLRASEN